jgi:N-acetylneuraminic acid mutarotase
MNLKDVKEIKETMYTLSFTNELIAFNLTTGKWLDPYTLTTNGKPPSGRHFHSSILRGDKIFIFGGKSNQYTNDMFEYDIENNQWNEIKQGGEVPSKRYGHSSVYDKEKDLMYLFGGYDIDGFVCNDIFKFDFTSLKWKEIKIDYNNDKEKIKPKPRFQSNLILFKKKIYFFGGITNNNKLLNDTLYFDLKKEEFVLVEDNSDIICPR